CFFIHYSSPCGVDQHGTILHFFHFTCTDHVSFLRRDVEGQDIGLGNDFLESNDVEMKHEALPVKKLHGHICFLVGTVVGMTFIPAPIASLATSRPILPKPMIPMIFPRSSFAFA